jgi:hypothetical protein
MIYGKNMKFNLDGKIFRRDIFDFKVKNGLYFVKIIDKGELIFTGKIVIE